MPMFPCDFWRTAAKRNEILGGNVAFGGGGSGVPAMAMNVSDEATKSLWMDIDVAPGARTLAQDIEADAVVVGPGSWAFHRL
jgi:carbamate kinase